ncbi:unnamed protein product, partial [Nesidiocoris tenuis]
NSSTCWRRMRPYQLRVPKIESDDLTINLKMVKSSIVLKMEFRRHFQVGELRWALVPLYPVTPLTCLLGRELRASKSNHLTAPDACA